eukprot:gene12094-biopygen9882
MTQSIGIELITGKNREHYRTLKKTQADAGRTLSLLKLQISREAQKAVEHQRAAGKVRGEAEGRGRVRRRVKMLKAAGGEADLEGRGGSG